MKGPTPIISSMLNSTAARRPMRRSRCGVLLPAVPGIIVASSWDSTLADCTLTGSMVTREWLLHASSWTVSSVLSAAFLIAGTNPSCMDAQAPDPAAVSSREPGSIVLPLAEDRGQNELEQTLHRLNTTASVMMIVAHPDDEDGPLLTYLSRKLGARATLFTLTRGEGGQNAISADV